jgi:ATP-binding cassette subfamily B protein
VKIANLINPFRDTVTPPPQTLAAFIRWALSGAWPMLFVAALFSAAGGALEVATAWILGVVIDEANTSGPEAFFSGDNLGLILGVIGFFVLLRPVVAGLTSLANNYIVLPNIPPLVLARLNRWTLGQSVTYFDDDFAGRIAQKQMQTSNALASVVSETITAVVFALASLFGTLALLGSIHPLVILPFAVWMVAYFALIRWFLPRIRKRSAARAGARAMVSGQVVDTITNIRTVKLFAHASQEDDAARDAMATLRERALEFGRLSASFRFFLILLAGTLPVLLLGSTLLLWQSGGATSGDIAAAGAMSIRIAQMTGWVSFTLMNMYANVGEIENGMKTLAPPRRVEDMANAPDLNVTDGEITFDNISFAYGRNAGGVSDISLTVKPGEKLGIVGASGAGKSTLVSLLLRLYDGENGRLLIDGQDVSKVTQDSLRHQIGMVTQETAMFNRSARENILYGQPDASYNRMIAAAEKAEAHDFITGLQDGQGRRGYDAHLGERGVKLSGGQRQRIALARAILKDAPILVLDEATSALDSEVEASI